MSAARRQRAAAALDLAPRRCVCLLPDGISSSGRRCTRTRHEPRARGGQAEVLARAHLWYLLPRGEGQVPPGIARRALHFHRDGSSRAHNACCRSGPYAVTQSARVKCASSPTRTSAGVRDREDRAFYGFSFVGELTSLL